DQILVTGPLGGSLFRGRHLRPEPRITEALALHGSGELRAMIDISDGLSSDLGHILEESGRIGAVLDVTNIPIHHDAIDQSLTDGIPALAQALHDGEDFELCVVVAPERARALLAGPPLPARLHRVGEVRAEPGLWLRHADGTLSRVEPRGFDHLRV